MTDGPFIYYRELLPCTSITRSVFFRSYNAKLAAHDEYLCTLLVNGIRIYKVCESSGDSDSKFLSLKYSKQLFGKPNGVVTYHDAPSNNDLLVLSLDAGKVVVVRCNMESNQFETVLLCNSEENAFGTGADLHVQSKGAKRFLGLGTECTINVCQENGVICSTIYGQHLVIIPAPKADSAAAKAATEESGKVGDTPGAADSQLPHQLIFSVDINATHGLTGPIIDTCFLNGYSKPVIAVLQQSGLMHIGHAARVRHCCTLTALAVNVESKTLSVLWQRTHLPHDCIRLLQITNPAYAGAVCVISLSAVVMANQEEAAGLAVNGFAAVTVDTGTGINNKKALYLGNKVGVKSGNISLQSWVTQEEGLELDASHWVEDYSDASSVVGKNNQNAIVGTLKDGTILRVTMALSTPHMLSSVLFTPEVVASSVRASCFSKSHTGDLWFLGSRQSAALLLSVQHRVNAQDNWRHQRNKHQIVDDAGSSFLSPAVKRLRSASVVSLEGNDVLTRGLGNGVGSPAAHPSSHPMSIADDAGAAGDMDDDAQAEELALYGNPLADHDGAAHSPVPLLRASSGGQTRPSTGISSELVLTVIDSVSVLGPMLHGLHTKQDSLFENVDSISWDREIDIDSKGTAQSTAASYIADRESRDGLLLSSGLDEDGSILKVFHGLHMTKLATRNLTGAMRVFTLPFPVDSTYGALLVVYENKTRVLYFTEQTKELRFKEMSAGDGGFTCSACTINIGVVVGGAECTVAQITPEGLRLARLHKEYGEEADALQDVLVADSREFGGLGGHVGETVLCGDVCAGYAVMLTSTHHLHVLRYDAVEDSMEVIGSVVGGAAATAMEVTDRDSEPPASLDSIVTSDIVSVSLYHGILDIDCSAAHPVSQDSSEQDVAGLAEVAEGKAERNAKHQQLLEEIYLYGAALPSETGSNSSHAEVSVAAGNQVKSPKSARLSAQTSAVDLAEQTYMIVTELNGTLSIVRLSNLKCVFQSTKFSQLADVILVSQLKLPASDNAVPEGLIVETKLVRLYEDELFVGVQARSTLCLAMLLSTGDLVTYSAVENSQGTMLAFHKIDQCPIVNKRSPDAAKLVRSVSNDGVTEPENGAVGSVSAQHSAYLSSVEYTTRGGPMLSALPVLVGGRGGILVSGNDATFVTTVQGRPKTISLGLPEVPCINYGHHSLVPFQVGNINAVAALWFECEDIETLKNPQAAAACIPNRAATLGIYQQVDGLELFPGACVSVKRIAVGKTTHRLTEIQNRSDDRTQQALLEKKTFLLACSEELKQPFLPSVLTETELQEDTELYERYLTSLESFCQPDSTVGQPPAVLQRLHTLALLQGTSVVDTYALPANECILDTEVLYLTMEKYITPPGQLMAVKFTEKRVFVAACTAIVEKRGEDTQGNGRLLLYAIDYALFEADAEEESAPKSDTKADTGVDGESAKTMEVDATADTSHSAGTSTKADVKAKDLASAQAKFLGAIKPKLRLIWSGPGPASVVKQLGEYVLSTVASTVYVYKFNSSLMELEQVSFFFAQVRLFLHDYCCFQRNIIPLFHALFCLHACW